jgi:competence protein ComEC
LSVVLWIPVVALASAVLLMLLTKRGRPAFFLFLLCFFVLGYIRSPEAGWNRPVCPSQDPACRKFPCILKVSEPPALCRWRHPVKVRVESVLVGFPWLESRFLLLGGQGNMGTRDRGGGFIFGTFHAPRPRLNPYSWDTALRYRREGILGTVIVRSTAAQSAPDSQALSRFRNRVKRLIQSAGTDVSRGVMEALLLGERAGLLPEVKDAMVKAGTYHVIAISGLHVGIVVLLVTSLITAAGPPRALRIALAVSCVAAYVLFTGARPSALRAGAFFVVLSLVRYLQWKVDIPNCVCAAGVILLIAFPHLAWDIGFRLSLAAVFGITLLVPQLYTGSKGGGLMVRVREHIRLGLLASFAAQAATLPILLYHFGRVSLMGLLSNLVVLPLVTLAVAAGLEASVAVLFCERLGLVLMKGTSAFVTLIIKLTSALTGQVDPVIFTGRPGVVKLVAYAFVLAYLGLGSPRIKRHWKLVALIALYAFLVVPFFRGHRRDMAVTFIHVGDGDACLVQFEGGEALLVDAGAGGGDYDAGRLAVLPLLAMKGVKRLNSVIVTHSHNDHYGGLASLLGNVSIGQVLVGAKGGERGYVGILDECRDHGVRVNRILRGDTLRYGDAVIEVFHPSEDYLGSGVDDPNAQSVVFKLIYGKTGFLFTGDVTPEVQRELMTLGFDLTCDVLKVPHHGAPGGVDRAHAQTCGARYAVVSAGSRFASHPSPDVLRLLERSGALTLVTKDHGAVTMVTDGENLRVTTEVLGPIRSGP